MLNILLGVVTVGSSSQGPLLPVISTISSRTMYQIEQEWDEDVRREVLLGDRQLDYVLLKMRFNEELLVSACPPGTSYGCSQGSCGCLSCQSGFQLRFKPLEGGATCESTSSFADEAIIPPVPDLVHAEAVCDIGTVPIRAAMDVWMQSLGHNGSSPFRMPAVHCPNYPHLEIFPMLSIWDEPVYLMLKMQNVCWRAYQPEACAQLMEKINANSNERIVNLAIITRVQSTKGAFKTGPTAEEFIRDCEIIPNVFGAKSGRLSASFFANDSEKLKLKPPVCDKKMFDTVIGLIRNSTDGIMQEVENSNDVKCVDDSNYATPPMPNPCWLRQNAGDITIITDPTFGPPVDYLPPVSTDPISVNAKNNSEQVFVTDATQNFTAAACPEVWEGMACSEYRRVKQQRLMQLLDEATLWTAMDAFSGCVSLANDLVDWQASGEALETRTVVTDRCAWQGWEKEWFDDPCCNRGLGLCCRETQRQVTASSGVVQVNTERMANLCAADTSGQALFLQRAIAAVRAFFKSTKDSGEVCVNELEEVNKIKTDLVSYCRTWLQGNVTVANSQERIAKVEECVKQSLGDELGLNILSKFAINPYTTSCEGDEVWRLMYTHDGQRLEIDQQRCEEMKRCNWHPFIKNEEVCENTRKNSEYCRKNQKEFGGRIVGEEISEEKTCVVDIYAAGAAEAANTCDTRRREQEHDWMSTSLGAAFDWYALQSELLAEYAKCMDKICKDNGGSGWSIVQYLGGICLDSTQANEQDCVSIPNRHWIAGRLDTKELCEQQVCSADESITDATMCQQQGFKCDRLCRKCLTSDKDRCVQHHASSESECNRTFNGSWQCPYQIFSLDGASVPSSMAGCLCVIETDTCGLQAGEQSHTCSSYKDDNSCWNNEYQFILQCQMHAVQCADQDECENQGQCSDWWVQPGQPAACLLPKSKDAWNPSGYCPGRVFERFDSVLVNADSKEYLDVNEWGLQDTGSPLGCVLQARDPRFDSGMDIGPKILTNTSPARPQDSSVVVNGTSEAWLTLVGFKLPRGSCQSCGCRDCLHGENPSSQQCIQKYILGEFSECGKDVPLCVPKFFEDLGMYSEEFSSYVSCSTTCSAAVASCLINSMEENCKTCEPDCQPKACFTNRGAVIQNDAECKQVTKKAFVNNRQGDVKPVTMCTKKQWDADCVACGGGLGCDTTSDKYKGSQCIRCQLSFMKSMTGNNNTTLSEMDSTEFMALPACQVCMKEETEKMTETFFADRNSTVVGSYHSLMNYPEIVSSLNITSDCAPLLEVGAQCGPKADVEGSSIEFMRLSAVCDAAVTEESLAKNIETDFRTCIRNAYVQVPRVPDKCLSLASKSALPLKLAKLLTDHKSHICQNYVPPPTEQSVNSTVVFRWMNDDILNPIQATDSCKQETRESMNSCSEATLTIGDLCRVPAETDLIAKLISEADVCKVKTICLKTVLRQLTKLFQDNRESICGAIRPDNTTSSSGNNTNNGNQPKQGARSSSSIPRRPVVSGQKYKRSSAPTMKPHVEASHKASVGFASGMRTLKWLGTEHEHNSIGRRLMEPVMTTSLQPSLPNWSVVFSSYRFNLRLRESMKSLNPSCLDAARGFFDDYSCLAISVNAVSYGELLCNSLKTVGARSDVPGADQELLFAAGCPQASVSNSTGESTVDDVFKDRANVVSLVLGVLSSELDSVRASWTDKSIAALGQCAAAALSADCKSAYVEKLVDVLANTVKSEVFLISDLVRSIFVGSEDTNGFDYMRKQESLKPWMCDAMGGKWYDRATSKADCLAKGQGCCRKQLVADGSCPWGFFSDETSDSCATCKGSSVTPMLQWYGAGKWEKAGEMRPKGEWIPRSLESVNHWNTQAIDWNKLATEFETALSQKTAEAYQNYARCRLGVATNALSELAGLCGTGNVEYLQKKASNVKEILKTELSRKTINPRIPSNVGTSATNVNIPANAFPEAVTIAMALTDAEEFKGSGEVLRTASNLARRLTETFSSCYTVVTNPSGLLVGQLVGGCVDIQADKTLSGSLTLCLPIDVTIAVNPSFSTADFAKYDSTTKKFTPLATPVESTSGTQHCQRITSLGMYCPIKRVENWTTATQSADGSCPSLDAELGQINSMQKDLGLLTADYISISQQDLSAGASFDAVVQASRSKALEESYESVNDPTQVSGGSITFRTDDDLAKTYGVALESVDGETSTTTTSPPPGSGVKEDLLQSWILGLVGIAAILM